MTTYSENDYLAGTLVAYLVGPLVFEGTQISYIPLYLPLSLLLAIFVAVYLWLHKIIMGKPTSTVGPSSSLDSSNADDPPPDAEK